jgi:hypothetical protein
VAGATVYLTGTPGTVDDAVVAGDIVYGANFATADGTPSAGFARVSIASRTWATPTTPSPQGLAQPEGGSFIRAALVSLETACRDATRRACS